MVAIRASEADDFLRRLPAGFAAVLLFGTDSGLIRERAVALVRAVAGSLDDPFNLARIEETALAADPGLLADEFNALSFTGGRRVIWVKDADRTFLRAVEPLLRLAAGSNLIIAEAGNLAKSAPLRSLFEKSRNACAIACYEESEGELRRLVETEAAAAGLAIEPEAERLLVGLLSDDWLMSRSEIAKLLLYVAGSSVITAADVEAVCGDNSARSVDGLIDAVMEGDMPGCDRMLEALILSGTAPGQILSAVASHIARLQQFRGAMDRGRSQEDAIRASKPPLFFKRHDPIRRQLRLWDQKSLAAAGTTLAGAVRATREQPALDHAITSRALLALTRSALARRNSVI
jgi:DNA polymerase-3 subunit delta